MEEQKQSTVENNNQDNNNLFSGFRIAASDDAPVNTPTPEELPAKTDSVQDAKVEATPTEKETIVENSVEVPSQETVTPTVEIPEQVEGNTEETGSDNMDLFAGFAVTNEPTQEVKEESTPVEKETIVEKSTVEETVPVEAPITPTTENVTQDTKPSEENSEAIEKQTDTPETRDEPSSIPSAKTAQKGVDWFLIILFVIIGGFILYMPQLNRLTRKKEKPKETPIATPTATPISTQKSEQLVAMNCVSNLETNYNGEAGLELPDLYNYKANGMSVTKTRVFYSGSDKLKKVENVITTTYELVNESNQSLFTAQKEKCDALKKTPLTENGYQYTCNQKDNTFVETETFDLTKNDEAVSIMKDGVPTTVMSGYDLDADVKTIKENLTQSGITCE